jgi:hypothetical protein
MISGPHVQNLSASDDSSIPSDLHTVEDSRTADSETQKPSRRKRIVFGIINLWLLMHLTAIITAPATVGPSSQTSRTVWEADRVRRAATAATTRNHMNNLTNKSDAELREIFEASSQTLASVVHSLCNRPDMQNAIARLMRPDDMLETFSELAVKDPDLMRLTLQASVASLVTAQSKMAADDEIQRRAVKGN